jgi:hypothetical protein
MSAAPASKDGANALIRWTAVAAVISVASVAAVISYRHAVGVVSAHGEPGAVGRMYPATIDGVIIAASMVLLDAERNRERPPALAWCLLSAGIGATIAVNVLAGIPSGWLGALVAAWPALAFVGCYELVMVLVRASARRAADKVAHPEPAVAALGGQAVTGVGRAAGPATDARPATNAPDIPSALTSAANAVPAAAAVRAGTGAETVVRPAEQPVIRPRVRARPTADARPAADVIARTRAAAEANPGKSRAEIGRLLGINERTVRRHLADARPDTADVRPDGGHDLAMAGAANGHALPGINGHDLTAPTP